MNKFNKTLLFFALFVVSSCEQENYRPVINEPQSYSPYNMKPVELGEPSAIPWTVENMSKAYENLKANPHATKYPSLSNARSSVDYVINTTHYYYRFLPVDSTQYETLINDDELSISDTPFEYDVQDDGVNYIDPEFQGTNFEFTYYYAVVAVDYQIPQGIEVEILAELHFTDEDSIDDTPTAYEVQLIDFFYDLNLEAQKISGELTEIEKEELTYKENSNQLGYLSYDDIKAENIPFSDVIIVFSEISSMEKRRRWTPSGTITVEDDGVCDSNPRECIVGLRNAYVKVRKWGWLVFRRAETNFDGFFETNSTRTKKVKYAVYFQPRETGLLNRTEFIVKAGTVFLDARHRGTNTYSRQPWAQHFSEGSHSHFYALVHNAAADFNFDWMGLFGLHSPGNGIKISAKFNGSNSNHDPIFTSTIPGASLFISHIRVGRVDNDGDYKGSVKIYATTIHELTHASHRRLDPGMFLDINGLFNFKERNLITESWAEGVETIITNHRYDNRWPSSSVDYNEFRQRMEVDDMTAYTPMFIDLNDFVNQNTVFATVNRMPPVDRVGGYTIEEMQDALDGAKRLPVISNRLFFGNPQNVTRNQLSDVFGYAGEVLSNLQD